MSDLEQDAYYPVFLKLKGKKCVVVGGGNVAERKVRSLLGTGAAITVVSPEITAGLNRLVTSGLINHKTRKYRKGDAAAAFLVIAATSDESVNRRVHEEAHGLINAVDMPHLCNFIVPSRVSKGPLQIAISSSGLSPALSRTIRKDLEKHVPEDLSRYLIWLKDIRRKIMDRMPGTQRTVSGRRSGLLKRLGSKEIFDIIRTEGFSKARAYAEKILEKNGER